MTRTLLLWTCCLELWRPRCFANLHTSARQQAPKERTPNFSMHPACKWCSTGWKNIAAKQKCKMWNKTNFSWCFDIKCTKKSHKKTLNWVKGDKWMSKQWQENHAVLHQKCRKWSQDYINHRITATHQNFGETGFESQGNLKTNEKMNITSKVE